MGVVVRARYSTPASSSKWSRSSFRTSIVRSVLTPTPYWTMSRQLIAANRHSPAEGNAPKKFSSRGFSNDDGPRNLRQLADAAGLLHGRLGAQWTWPRTPLSTTGLDATRVLHPLGLRGRTRD